MTRRALLAVPLLLLPACGAAATSPPGEPAGVTVLGAGVSRSEADVSDEQVAALARAQLDLALDVYGALAPASDGDLVLGPTSLHTALLMVRAGAAGSTAREMDDVLGLAAVERPHDTAAALDAALRARGEVDGVDLDTAQRVWADRSLELEDEFVAVLARAYDAGVAELDLAADPEAAREAVNAWVAGRTRDRVEELMPPGSIDGSTLLVLASAIALDAAWELPFDPDRTTAAPFTLADGSVRQVPTMRFDESLPAGRGPGYTAVRLPYAGEELAMTVVVPDDLASFEAGLDADRLDQVEASITDGGIHLSLPRFTARSAAGLLEVLGALGMPTALGPGADFSGMTGSPDLFLSAVEHQAVVEVDEEGTRAAAATGAAMAGSHGPTVTVDRPFLFVVRDRATGAVLFLGRVTDPR